jgi:hypothetical protein
LGPKAIGFARETDNPKTIAAKLAKTGTILKRPALSGTDHLRNRSHV